MRASAGPAPGPPDWGPGLGLLLTSGPSEPAAWPGSAEVFAALDDDGCSALWFPDHLFWGHDLPEPLVMAAVAASATRRCVVGTGVIQLPLRRAATVAKAAATLQHISGGRFVLGVGSGDHAAEYERAGAAFGRRGRDLDAGILELARCWAEPTDWYGQRPVPAPIPLWVGGRSAAALARAARVAAGWMPVFSTPEQFQRDGARLDALVHAAGRPSGAVRRGVVALVSPTGPRWTRADALDWVGRLWRTDPTRLDRYLITGSATDIAVELRRYAADHVTVLVAADEPIGAFGELNRAHLSLGPASGTDSHGGDDEGT